jgi:hypothetical protein
MICRSLAGVRNSNSKREAAGFVFEFKKIGVSSRYASDPTACSKSVSMFASTCEPLVVPLITEIGGKQYRLSQWRCVVPYKNCLDSTTDTLVNFHPG